MKLLTKEEEAAHYRATLQGGTLGVLAGLAVGTVGVVGAARRYPAFNQLTLPLKAFLITSAGTFAGIIAADHSSRKYESSRNPANEAYATHEEDRRKAEFSRMSWTQRAMAWGREERYKIVGVSWLGSMVAAFALVGRNPYLTGQQKLVQARVYAQGLTLAVLIASAAFEVQDSRDEKGRYQTVEYEDANHKKQTKQEMEHSSDGDPLWKDMVKQEEERLKERDDAIKRMEETDRKRRANNKVHKEQPRKAKTEDKAEVEERKEAKIAKKQDAKEGRNEEEEEGEEEEEAKEEYKPIPGKKGEGKMMRKVSDPPNPGVSAIP